MNCAASPNCRTTPCRRIGHGWPLLVCGLWLAGCGVQAYEAQLNNANELFAYQTRLDQSLARTPWDAAGYGVSMRVPHGYTAIPAPAPVAVKEGAEGEAAEEAEAPVDLRQPTYLGVPEIEGLIGAWKATVPSTDGSNAVVFLYIFGNHSRMLNNSAQPGEGQARDEYLDHLESVLQTQLGVTIEQKGGSANQPNTKFQESIPRDEKFVRRKEFDVVRLVPSDGALQELQLPKLEAYLYEHRAGGIQVAVLLVTPTSVRENPENALRVALETLSVSDRMPERRVDGQVGQPAPKSGF
jgi:hypothetical protein